MSRCPESALLFAPLGDGLDRVCYRLHAGQAVRIHRYPLDGKVKVLAALRSLTDQVESDPETEINSA
jgi:hypothetical protein